MEASGRCLPAGGVPSAAEVAAAGDAVQQEGANGDAAAEVAAAGDEVQQEGSNGDAAASVDMENNAAPGSAVLVLATHADDVVVEQVASPKKHAQAFLLGKVSKAASSEMRVCTASPQT